MVDFGIAKWHHHKSYEFDGMNFFQDLKSLFKNYVNLKHVANNVWIFDSYKNSYKNKT
jgi:hypothetical protein